MAKYCSKCGTQLKDGAKICSSCGTKVGLTVYPLKIKETGKVIAISLAISIAIIIITMLVGIFVLSSTDTSNKVFDIEVGFPFSWFQISHLTNESGFTIGIFSWANLIGDLILYFILCFVLSYIGEMFYAGIKSKK